MHNRVILRDGKTGAWFAFSNPHAIVQTNTTANLVDKLAEIEALVYQNGWHAAGFIGYEAASAFDAALVTHEPKGRVPLLWFGLFDEPEQIELESLPSAPYHLTKWQADVDEANFCQQIEAIKAEIAAGRTYQVNYTFRLHSQFDGDPLRLFLALQQAQEGDFGAFVQTAEFAICSASPELFFMQDGATLTSLPMKGTAPRGLTWEDDEKQVEWLKNDEKNRAENVMIVDMIRNDLGRVASLGSVRVPSLFDVARYPTVLQMTSTVSAETTSSLTQIMQALFPCASITGAPKVQTMQIIKDLETAPRGIYTGSIGYFTPKRKAQFNVAIRTVAVDGVTGSAEYGTGSGVVWDSDPSDEYRECLLKASVLTHCQPEFDILETMLWRPESGYWLLDEHVSRMCKSAEYFGYPTTAQTVRSTLLENQPQSDQAHKVRLLLNRNGQLRWEHYGLEERGENELVVGFSAEPIDSHNRFLYHKTTNRDVYKQARAANPHLDDVILWNERGEITETTFYNIILEIDGELLTPATSSGLLGGTLRQSLLANNTIREAILTKEDFYRTNKIWLINSVRGWRKAILRQATNNMEPIPHQ